MNTKDFHLGVTGTRSGMTDYQRKNMVELISYAIDVGLERGGETYFHHGDCVGVDAQAAQIAKDLGCIVVGHPPVKDNLRAFFDDDETLPVKGYFQRNRDIVESSELLSVVPWQMEWSNTGGTWYTHDYAIKKNKELIVLWPN